MNEAVYLWEPSNATLARRYGIPPERILRFDTNTSPQAPSWLREALAGPLDPPVNEYPDSTYAELTSAAAAYCAVPEERVVVGAGADEVLDLIAKAFLPAGSAALMPIPTYSMYGVLTAQRGARVLAVPRLGPEGAFALDLEAVLPRVPEVRVIWLCAPNNPTGAPEPRANVEAVLETSARIGDDAPLVVVDEAYHEFTGETVIGLIERFPNLVVVRTVSKAFALAGMRVGWAVGARPVIARLERVRPPGSIATPSAIVAARALCHPEGARAVVAAVAAERGRLAEGLAAAGWQPRPSVTNFVLARVGDQAAAEQAAERLLRAGIVPRTFGPANPLRGHLRLTVRSTAEDDRLFEVLAR